MYYIRVFDYFILSQNSLNKNKITLKTVKKYFILNYEIELFKSLIVILSNQINIPKIYPPNLFNKVFILHLSFNLV